MWIFRINSWQELAIGLAIRIFIILFILPVHEFAHGYVAGKLGDPTAKMSGRLTLNPMAHIDWIGAALLVFFGFGWAKPVPVNPYNFRDRAHKKRGMALTALAGPVSNLLFALAGMIVLRILTSFNVWHNQNTQVYIAEAFYILMSINVSLAVFNLLPIYPLDGSRILGGILPDKFTNFMERNGQIISFVLIILMFSNAFGNILGTAADAVTRGMFTLVNGLFNVLGLRSKGIFDFIFQAYGMLA